MHFIQHLIGVCPDSHLHFNLIFFITHNPYYICFTCLYNYLKFNAKQFKQRIFKLRMGSDFL